MTPRPELMGVLELLPAVGWISEPELTELAAGIGAELEGGKIRGLRSLRRCSAALMDDHGEVPMWKRTPTGTDALRRRARAHPGPIPTPRDARR